MSKTISKKTNCRLPDGREIRALERRVWQAEMFSLKGKIPRHEEIIGVRDCCDANLTSFPGREMGLEGLLRTGRYGVYARGFEKELDKPIGARLVWIEMGMSYTFNVPDVRHPHDKDKGLRQATGMADFAFDKLQYDEARRLVSVTQDFNPETDVVIRDIMRPREWSLLIDLDGYPLRSEPSVMFIPVTKLSYVRHADEFEGESNGFHGSVAAHISDSCHFVWGRDIGAGYGWLETSQVVVVGRAGERQG
jgi:hypothetical protein